jgi:hypothetical protein
MGAGYTGAWSPDFRPETYRALMPHKSVEVGEQNFGRAMVVASPLHFLTHLLRDLGVNPGDFLPGSIGPDWNPACLVRCEHIYENGGQGPGFDASAFRGKLFGDVQAGRIRDVCVYASSGTVARVAIKAAPTGIVQWRGDIQITTSGWNCIVIDELWSATSLFIYKEAGDAAVGYDGGSPADGQSSNDGGATWSPDGLRRGYKVRVVSGVVREGLLDGCLPSTIPACVLD